MTFDEYAVAMTEAQAGLMGLNGAVSPEYTPPSAEQRAAIQQIRGKRLDELPPDLRAAVAAMQCEPDPLRRALIEARQQMLARASHDDCPACNDAEADQALLEEYEKRYCIESDYMEDDETHPVGSALVRLTEAAKGAQVSTELVQHNIQCPDCRRQYATVWVPRGTPFTYATQCRGCELEGRR